MALCMSSYSREHLCVYQEITASHVSGWVSPLAAMGSQNKDAEPLQTVETAPGGGASQPSIRASLSFRCLSLCLSFSVNSPLRGVKQAASLIISVEDRGAGLFLKHRLHWAGDTETHFLKTTTVVTTYQVLSTCLAPHWVLYTPR